MGLESRANSILVAIVPPSPSAIPGTESKSVSEAWTDAASGLKRFFQRRAETSTSSRKETEQ